MTRADRAPEGDPGTSNGGVSGLGESVTTVQHGPVMARHAGRIYSAATSEAMAIGKARIFCNDAVSA